MQAALSGTRLSYVVVPQEGTVRRAVHKWKKGAGVNASYVEEPAGYLVYFPRGHVIRIKDKKELRHYHLDRDPKLVNLQGLNDPNSAIGRLMLAQDESSRVNAMADLQKQCMNLAQAQSGRIELCRDASELAVNEEAA